MVDREKVIKSLKIHVNWETDCIGCSYLEDGGKCIMNLQNDALELLKEQEPVLFKVTRHDKSYPFWDSVCTGCGYKTSTVKNYWKYCPVCGRKVKWDE